MAPRKNPRGIVFEMILPAKMPGDKPRAFRQVVIFDGTLLERATTDAARRKHWRAAHYGEGNLAELNVMDTTSWLGRWLKDHETEGYELYGKPFLIEANHAEKVEIDSGNMPRALVLRLDKARTEVGAVRNPWTGE
jgi:hypothetical protein